jgi:hypothetical protein
MRLSSKDWTDIRSFSDETALGSILGVLAILSLLATLFIGESFVEQKPYPASYFWLSFGMFVSLICLLSFLEGYTKRQRQRVWDENARKIRLGPWPTIPDAPVYVAPPSPSSPPPSIPTAPEVNNGRMTVRELEQLRATALHEFRNHPLKHIPPIFIEPLEHFLDQEWAHYERRQRIICFSTAYVEDADISSLLDTMIHELLHAWIHENELGDGDPHGKSFEAACKLLGIHFNPAWRKT